MKYFLILITTFFSLLHVKAQQRKDTTDVKVGLVLSGGGAKGLAHIGVLKVIDESGIRLGTGPGASSDTRLGIKSDTKPGSESDSKKDIR